MIVTQATSVKATGERNIEGIISGRRRTPQCRPFVFEGVRQRQRPIRQPCSGLLIARCYRAATKSIQPSAIPGHCPPDRQPEARQSERQAETICSSSARQFATRVCAAAIATTTKMAGFACASGCSEKKA
jgi:hypothetical protein